MHHERKINIIQLRLSGVEAGEYHVDGLVDGKTLLRAGDEEMDIPFGVLPSIDREGDYFMVTCSCGDPGCAGYFEPAVVTHEGDLIHWICSDLNWHFTFERKQYEAEIRRLIDEGRRRAEGDPSTGKGHVHQNVELFKNKEYEHKLPSLWDNDQRNRADERQRKELWVNDPEEFQRRYRQPGGGPRLKPGPVRYLGPFYPNKSEKDA